MIEMLPTDGTPGGSNGPGPGRMNRLLLVGIAAAVVLGAGYALGAGKDAESAGSVAGVSLLAILAICLSLAGAAIGVYAAMSARRTQADVARLARSIDNALRDLAEGNSRNSSTLGALTDTIDRQIGGMLDRIDVATGHPGMPVGRDAAAGASNVVPLGAPGRRNASHKAAAADPAPSSWAAQGELELSLEPIVSVSQSAAAGFEVYANLPFADGVARPVRRLRGDAAAADHARFELALIKAAMHASRRQLPGDAARLPLHVAASDALLADADAAAEIAQLFELHPALASALVLSIPVETAVSQARGVQRAIARLMAAGVRLAVEGHVEPIVSGAKLADGKASFLKLTCNRLLDRDKAKRKAATGSDLAELAHASGVTLIATDVATDEDAVALLDLGVDLMSGARFSPPRRLRGASAEVSGKVAEA
jgi:EAL domain-containing protein (putative c-di-GMP-specific phosphodiesterase class I)